MNRNTQSEDAEMIAMLEKVLKLAREKDAASSEIERQLRDIPRREGAPRTEMTRP